jgi:hypothetical protein
MMALATGVAPGAMYAKAEIKGQKITIPARNCILEL